MKTKRFFKLLLLVVFILTAATLSACPAPTLTPFQIFEEYSAAIANITELSYSATVKAGENIVAQKTTKYEIGAADITVTVNESKLSEDLENAGELVELAPVISTLPKGSSAVPSLGLSEGINQDSQYDYKVNGNNATLSFRLNKNRAAAFLGLTQSEVDKIDSFDIALYAENGKIVKITLTYTTEKGNDVIIELIYTYGG